jgi:hypothetical protein
MIPSVTNGAIIGSAASKKHEKLPRGLSATMIVLPRNHRKQHRNLPKLLTDDRENGANIPGGVPEVYAGRDGSFSANTPTQRGSRRAASCEISVRVRSTSSGNGCSSAHWRCCTSYVSAVARGCRGPCWQDLTFSAVVCTWQNGQRGQGGNCHMYLANLLRVPATHCV